MIIFYLYVLALSVYSLQRQTQSDNPSMKSFRRDIAVIVLCIIGIMLDVYFGIRV